MEESKKCVSKVFGPVDAQILKKPSLDKLEKILGRFP